MLFKPGPGGRTLEHNCRSYLPPIAPAKIFQHFRRTFGSPQFFRFYYRGNLFNSVDSYVRQDVQLGRFRRLCAPSMLNFLDTSLVMTVNSMRVQRVCLARKGVEPAMHFGPALAEFLQAFVTMVFEFHLDSFW
jgi:hypothetical protein